MTDPTSTTPALDLAALTLIAKAATPGPWTAEPYSYGVQDGRIRVTSPSDSGIYNLAEDVSETDAAHIAAFDPPTVLALIARAGAAEAAVAAVRELHCREVIAVHEGHGEEAMCPRCQTHWPCKTIRALDGTA